jgi:beta-lactamase superfamily II metal-dependent hydrolase
MNETKRKFASPIFLLLLAGMFIYLGFTYLQPVAVTDGVKLTFLDVGQGDAALAVTPKGQEILIDGGPDDSVVAKLDKEVPFYSHKIDAVVLTHPHADHVAGLVAVAKKYQIGRVYMSGVTHTAPEYIAFLEALKANNVPVQIVKSGDKLDFGDGVKLDFLYPLTNLVDTTAENLNLTSVVTRLSLGNSSAIIMGDLESEGQDKLLASGQNVKSDIIKVSHHGSKDSVNAKFLAAVDPKYAVISVGKGNSFGHPSKDMLTLLAGRIVYRTDQDQDVRFVLTTTGVASKI